MDNDMDWHSLERFSFGDSPELADELAELVLTGKKRATCWAAGEGPKTQVGKQWVVLDGTGDPIAVIETVELTQRRFDEVDAAFAFDDGEDGSHARLLASGASELFWPTGHLRPEYAALLRTLPAGRPHRCERFPRVSRAGQFASAMTGRCVRPDGPLRSAQWLRHTICVYDTHI